MSYAPESLEAEWATARAGDAAQRRRRPPVLLRWCARAALAIAAAVASLSGER